MADFSQSGEEAFILEWADRRTTKGRWLDLGAADGVSASNTRALALRGWGGVAVEPGARQFDRLAMLYADRDDVECVQAAVVVDDSPLVRFHYSHDLISTTEDENAETWKDLATFVPVYVATVTVSQLLDAFPGRFDFASVDTEGTSIELWDELRRLDAFNPGALAVIEAEDGNERRVIQEAAHEGWHRIAATPNNVIVEYVKPQR